MQSNTAKSNSHVPRGGDGHEAAHKSDGVSQDWMEHSRDAAQAANIAEHDTTVREALRTHKWAVVWSLLVSTSIIMEGYDTILIGNFLGYPAFQKQFGAYSPSSGYQVSAQWQSGLSAGSQAGAIVGAFLNGVLLKRFGFKPVFLVSLVLMVACVFPSFFGKTVAIQTVGQILCSVPWGVFATIGPAYASEILPLALRPYLTAYTNMCFAIGQFIGAGVLQGLLSRDDQWSYRIPYAIEWVWPIPLFFVCLVMPESPWWLVRQGRLNEAERVLKRVTTGTPNENAKQTIAMMVHTNNMELGLEEGTSYLDCFRGSNRRRTEIACVVFAGQVLAGSQFAYSGTYFFEQAGMSAADAYKLGLGGTAIAFVGTILSWFLMKNFGRRTIYLGGMAGIVLYLFIIGVLTTARHNSDVEWAQSALTIIWLFTFSLSTGPIGWTIPAEVSSTRLRSKTIVLARNSYYLCIIVANIIEPYMMNPTQWNWRGYTGFFWCGAATLTLLWSFFRLAETRNRTFEELDIMFAAEVPTRQFASYKVDAYAEDLDFVERVKHSVKHNEKV